MKTILAYASSRPVSIRGLSPQKAKTLDPARTLLNNKAASPLNDYHG